MTYPYQQYDSLIDQLIDASTAGEISSTINKHQHLLTPDLIERVQTRIKSDDLPTGILAWMKDTIIRHVTWQWLKLAADQQEAFLTQYQIWLVSDVAYEFLIGLAQQHESDCEYIEYNTRVLVEFTIQLYMSLEQRRDKQQLLFKARQLFSVEWLKKSFPKEWALLQKEIGLSCLKSTEGDRAKNLEAAIEAFKLTLPIFTQQTWPYEWADSQTNLGVAFQYRVEGNRAQNLEQAIEAFKLALLVFTPSAWHSEWARVQNNLGTTYLIRLKGDRALNLEDAIEFFRQALTVRIETTWPFEWANTQHNLGLAYSFRVRGDRAQNLEDAIEDFGKALTVFTPSAWPYDWATTQNTLGLAYFHRVRGDRAQNLEDAIEAFEQALKVHSRQVWPVEWAGTYHNLGSAYNERLKEDRAQNVEAAINAYQLALTVRSKQAMPYDWASTQHNLGNASRNRIFGDRAQNIEYAIEAYDLATSVFSIDSTPYDWANTKYTLGLSYQDRIYGDRSTNQRRAVDAFQQALTIQTPDLLPAQCLTTASALGNLLFQQEQWREAKKVLELAHLAAENERQQQYTDSRQRLAQQTAVVYASLVAACLETGDSISALDYALAAIGRSDAERLGSVQPLQQLAAYNPNMMDYYLPVLHLQQSLAELGIRLESHRKPEGINQSPNETYERQIQAQISRDIIQTRLALTKALEQLRFRFPLATGSQYTPSLTSQHLIRLANQLDATLVQYFQHANGWVAFVITPNQIYQCVNLPGSLQTTLGEQFASGGILNSYQSPRPEQERICFKTLYRQLIAPLEDCLPSTGKLIIAAPGILHRVPFAALWKQSTTARLIDQYQLSTVSSLSFLFSVFQQRKLSKATTLNPTDRLLSVVYPGRDRSDESYLQQVHSEAEAAAQQFTEVEQLHNEFARPERLIERCRQQAYSAIHFGCHGKFDAEFPEYSCLQLNGRLTVQQIVNELRLPSTPLITLGACQTSLAESSEGGDMTGLSQAFFLAGATTIVGSLWPVADESTRELFAHFYAKRSESGVSEVEALSYAQRQLRNNSRWQDAYYWAAFQILGLPN
jgi:CHAT domain-containing protein